MDQIRQHPWYLQIPNAASELERAAIDKALDEDVLEQLDKLGYPKEQTRSCLKAHKHNHATAAYQLLLQKVRRAAEGLNAQSDHPSESHENGDKHPHDVVTSSSG